VRVVTFIARAVFTRAFKFFFDPVIKRVPPLDCVFEKEIVPDIRAEQREYNGGQDEDRGLKER
jgi:hypothetical protein